MASTTITPSFLSSAASVTFSSSSDVNAYFTAKTGALFPNWFNACMAQKDNWANVRMDSDPALLTRFNALWNQIPVLFGSPSINLLQFISLMSIVNNETGGKLKPATELVGSAGNPGLAYAFNTIPGTKKSYNTLASNITAYDLFHNADYIAQHGSLAMGAALKNTTDIKWKGEAWPAGIDTSTDPAKTGFIQEADFFKFRGRGFIQTTTRGNYKQLVSFIQSYTGPNAVIKQYQANWRGKTPDVACTISCNADWDNLFQNTDLIIAAAAINIHSRSAGNYLSKITMQPGAEAAIRQMGRAISGTNTYADLFLKRVIQQLNGLGN
ncbi:MAG: hypothetical protein ACXVPD_09220 [Bacteroidia bacterium]